MKLRSYGCARLEVSYRSVDVPRPRQDPEEKKKRQATYHAHSFAKHVHNSLISEGPRVGEEEVAQHDVKERERRDDRFCGYERHGGRTADGDRRKERLFDSTRRFESGKWPARSMETLRTPLRRQQERACSPKFKRGTNGCRVTAVSESVFGGRRGVAQQARACSKGVDGTGRFARRMYDTSCRWPGGVVILLACLLV